MALHLDEHGGHAEEEVDGAALTRSKTWSTANARPTTEAPPTYTSGVVKTLRPPVWKSGALSSAMSSEVRPQLTTVLAALAVMERWVRMAALGMPVLPPV